MDLTGLHHVTAITARPADNRRFYTGALGLRLVKKTVNQDDTTAYHLFYADAQASPGSDLTFFDFPVPPAQRGTHSIVTTALRVTGQDSLAWWLERLRAEGAANVGEIEEWHGRAALRFERVSSCKCRDVASHDKNKVLNLLAVSFSATDGPSGVVTLLFSGGAVLRLEVECLEAELADLGPTWVTECCPAHVLEDVAIEGAAGAAAGGLAKQG